MALSRASRLPQVAAKLIGLLTIARLKRAWYYLRIGQHYIVFDRVARLCSQALRPPVRSAFYFPCENQGPLEVLHTVKPRASILIPVLNHWGVTRGCLASILENTQSGSYEIIVADDGSSDETADLPRLAPGVRHVVNSSNLGFLRNCNKAARSARGEFLIFLNNDTVVQPGWLTALVQTLESDARIGLVGPMLCYPNGQVQEAGGIVWADASGWNYGRYDDPERPEYNYVKEVDYVSGACIAVRRTVWEEIGGFDETFAPAYYEDTDLAFQIREKGYRVVYQPLSRVVHIEGVSHGVSEETGIKRYQVVNQMKFFTKWHDVLQRDHGRDPRDLDRARDRSMHRKRVLFIDHYVPKWDQDAGSRSTWQYLSLMASMGYQITFFGDDFVDDQPYTRELQKLGVEVLYGFGLHRRRKRWLETHARQFDYIYLSRPNIARCYLRILKRNSTAKIIYCAHDLHCLRAERQYEVERKRAHLMEARKWARWEEGILRSVDMGYFFSKFEVEEVRRRFSGVTVRSIPLYLFETSSSALQSEATFSERSGLLFVGGFMHEPNVDAVTWFARKVLPAVRTALPSVNFTIVGSNPPKAVTALESEHVQVLGRIPDEELALQYRRARVVVAPLRYGAGVKGKIVEAMQHGVPTITTTIGAEGILGAEGALRVADEAASFAEHVVTTHENDEKWEAASRASLKAIRLHYSTSAAKTILLEDMPL
jgi:O-antigen biosynthesis protein